MARKIVIYVLIFALSASVFFAVAFFSHRSKSEQMVLGHYTFENTRNNIQRLNRINMITGDGGAVNIVRDGEVWRFREAADYYCSSEMLAEFYRMVNDSLIMSIYAGNDDLFAVNKLSIPDSQPDDTQGTRIITYDEENNKLDDIIIGAEIKDDDLVQARKTDGRYMYRISGVGGFSGEPYAWMPYPLLSIDENNIAALIIGNKYLDKEILLKIILHSRQLKQILRVLSYVQYGSIIKKDDFFAQNPTIEGKKVKVETGIGLVYVFDIFEVKGTYWLRIGLETTKIPQKDVVEFVKNNQRYFSDWLFQTTIESGKILYNADEILKNK